MVVEHRRRRLVVSLALGLLGAASTATLAIPDAAVAAGKKKPDLVIESVASPDSLVAGGSTRIRVATGNAGRRAAVATTSTIWLSTDRVRGRTDRKVGSRRVDRLRPDRTSTMKIRLRIPAATSPGRYFLVACADARKQVRESKERNNCRASRPVSITGAAPPPPPPPPAGSTPSEEVTDELTRVAGPLWWLEAQPTGTRLAPITVDEGRTTTRTIGSAGGALTVSTASGDSMTLTIPAGALLEDVEIEAAPVTAIEGDAAVGARAVGLRLAPEGITLHRPATLAITPSEGLRRAAVGLAGLDDGSGTGPAVILPELDRLAMPIQHFSHHTVLVATGEGGFVAQYLTDAEYGATIRDRVVQVLTEERNKEIAGEPEDPNAPAEVRRLLDDYFAEVVTPLVERATTDCGFAEARLHEAVSFARFQALSFGEEETAAQQQLVFDGFGLAVRNCWEELTAECMPMDGERWRKLLALERQAALSGTTLSNGQHPDPLDPDQVRWCGTMHGWIDGEESYEYAQGEITDREEASWRIWITADPYVFADDEGRPLQIVAGTSETVGSRYEGSGSRRYVQQSDCTHTIEHAWTQPPKAFAGNAGVPHFRIYFTETGADPAPQPISGNVYGGSVTVKHDLTETDCHGSQVLESSSRFTFLGNVGEDMSLTWDAERLAFDLVKVDDRYGSYRATGSLFLSPSALRSP